MRAVGLAADLAQAMRSERLRVVVAFEPIPAYLGQPILELAFRSRIEGLEGILRLALALVGDIPAEVHKKMIAGFPAAAIIQVPPTWNSSLIVMGARGKSTMADLMPGSTSQKVVSHAPCPVLIVR